LVVDEVHASDTYMGRLLDQVLHNHISCGGHALLLSATLGSVMSSRLLMKSGTKVPLPEEATSIHYPLVTCRVGDREDVVSIEVQAEPRTKKVCIETVPYAGSPDRVAALALAAAKEGARVLVIRNTVRDCIETQRAMETLSASDVNVLFQAKGITTPHHSRYAVPDRRLLDAAIENTFGKESSRSGVVVIGTQTVEQSLDIDADFMITDLCPCDVLLQRIGRLHRHNASDVGAGLYQRRRPKNFRTARCIVLVSHERSMEKMIRICDGSASGPNGLGTVYEDLRCIEATWRMIEAWSTWNIPEMNRKLVELTTHPDVLKQICIKMGGRWIEHHKYILGIQAAHKAHAKLGLLSLEKPFGDEEFPRNLERAKTRLGTGDRRIEFPEKLLSPFGNPFRELVLPGQYARTAEDDARIQDIIPTVDNVHFTFSGRTFIYDRLGLRPAENNREEDGFHGK